MKNVREEFYPVALTVAGSDSGGGAGIQADLRTFNAFGVFGCSVITSVTAQNPLEVRRIDTIPPEGVRAQLDAVLDRIEVRAVKTGMIGSAENVLAVAEKLKSVKIPVVVDPVMVSTSGARLLPENAVSAVRESLLPLADWITPNIPEAELLLGRKLSGRAALIEAAGACAEKWHCICLLKSGHAEDEKDLATDFAALPDGRIFAVSSPRIEVPFHVAHGTGCTLSSAIAAVLAQKQGWKTALAQAKSFVFGSLNEPARIGHGIAGMYPPVEDYDKEVHIREVE